MARPTEFNTITVIQDYVNFLGTISTGTVTFEPPNTFFKAEVSDVAITPKAIVGTLNTQGRLEVVLPFTDDPDIIPSFTYHVTENIDGLKRSTDIQIPIDLAAQGQPVKLYDLVVVGAPVVVGDNLLTKGAADLLYVKVGDAGAGGGFSTWAEMMAAYPDEPATFKPEIGPGADQAVAGNDSRLTNMRTPTDGSVTTVKLADGAVTSVKIADGTIVNGDIAPTAAISLDKTSDSTAGAGRLAMNNAERTKLGTVATGATANSNDTYLLTRGNHSGEQAITTITGLSTALGEKTRYRGPVTVGTAYEVNDMVVLDDGRLARVLQAHTAGSEPTATNAFWEVLPSQAQAAFNYGTAPSGSIYRVVKDPVSGNWPGGTTSTWTRGHVKSRTTESTTRTDIFFELVGWAPFPPAVTTANQGTSTAGTYDGDTVLVVPAP